MSVTAIEISYFQALSVMALALLLSGAVMRQHTIRKRSASRASVSTPARSPASRSRRRPPTPASCSGARGSGERIPARPGERGQLALRDHDRSQRHAHPDRRAPDGRRGGPGHRQPRHRGGRPRDPGARRQRQAVRRAAHARRPRPAVRAAPAPIASVPAPGGKRRPVDRRSCRRRRCGSATRSTTITRRSGRRFSRGRRPSGRSSRSTRPPGPTAS